MSISDEILKSIQIMIDKELGNYKSDHTFKSAIKSVTPKGYTIIDESGTDRIVKCAVPGVKLKVGMIVWVKIPCGNINEMHICGVI